MPSRHHIAIFTEPSFGYCRGVAYGVRVFLGDWPGWTVAEYGADAEGVRWACRDGMTGAVAHVARSGLEAELRTCGVSVVNTSQARIEPMAPLVGMDNRAIGRMAAHHLLERGLSTLVLAPSSTTRYGRDRAEGFRDALPDGVRLIDLDEDPAWKGMGLTPAARKRRAARLAALPRPAGLFAIHDPEGASLLELCREAGIHVPGDLAVLGVNDERSLCTTTTPSLSSISVPARAIGEEAARMLAGLIEGRPPPSVPVLLAPTAVVARGSTDVWAHADPVAAQALAFIRAHAGKGIRVTAIADAVHASVSKVEKSLRGACGRRPRELIHDEQVRQAQILLRTTDLPLDQVASACGFADARRLWAVFKARAGTTPGAWRKLHAEGTPGTDSGGPDVHLA